MKHVLFNLICVCIIPNIPRTIDVQLFISKEVCYLAAVELNNYPRCTGEGTKECSGRGRIRSGVSKTLTDGLPPGLPFLLSSPALNYPKLFCLLLQKTDNGAGFFA